jgi:cytochrome c oxidase assembly factor CtaG
MRRIAPSLALALAAAAFAPAPLLAHAGRPVAPHDVWAAWTFDWAIVIPLFLSAWLYSRGLERMWRRSGAGRGLRRWEAACFACGWLALFAALVSPVHAMGEALFSAHMVQHELLMAVAAPLLVLGRPVIPFLWALPVGWRRGVGRWAKAAPVRVSWRWMTAGSVAFVLHAAALWLWHLPFAYGAAVASGAVHALQHASFLGTGLLFWWAVVHRREGRMGHGASILYLFVTAMHSGALGALLTLTNRPWYPSYAASTAAWGLTPLEDQQLAGLIMWIPAGAVYLVAALALVAAWFRDAERRGPRWQAEALGTT